MAVLPLRVLLRERRRALDIGTIEAARLCGVSQGAYSRYENGRQPEEEALDGIANFLGLSRRAVVLARSADYVAADDEDEVARLARRVDELEAVIRRLGPPEGTS